MIVLYVLAAGVVAALAVMIHHLSVGGVVEVRSFQMWMVYLMIVCFWYLLFPVWIYKNRQWSRD